MSRIHCIALPNPGPILTTFVLINFRLTNEPAWDIASLELYADVEMTKLLADDVHLADFPREEQDKIYAGLNDYTEQRMRLDARLMRLAIERVSMVPA
jgi:hypothetical protein